MNFFHFPNFFGQVDLIPPFLTGVMDQPDQFPDIIQSEKSLGAELSEKLTLLNVAVGSVWHHDLVVSIGSLWGDEREVPGDMFLVDKVQDPFVNPAEPV